jgi:N6-adenosine-specific RNA methylase IME4
MNLPDTRLEASPASSAWAARIVACWQASVTGILEVGRLLTAAKDALPHGEFEAMINAHLPFVPRTAQMLMAIAADPRLSNPKHVSLLPPSWGTLYELTKLSDEQFSVSLSAGKIRPDVERGEITAIKKEAVKTEHAKKTYVGCDLSDLNRLVAEGRKFKAILIDPPWKFVTRSPKGEGRSAGEHYTTTGLDSIKALPVAELAGSDCAMFMWMVDWCPKWAFELIEHWKFEHKTTAFTWAKQNGSGVGWHMGQGYWTRANPEDCWLATRGQPQRIYADVRQLIVAPVMEHSRKPDEIHDRIMRLVDGPYLELYARRPRAGWVTWGNEMSREEFAQPESTTPHDPETGEIYDDLEPPAFMDRRAPATQGVQ